MVTAGDYKGANIIYKAFSEKIYLEAKGILAGKTKVELNKKTVRKMEVKGQSQTGVVTDYQVVIYFADGKKSQMLRLNTKPLTSICRWSALLPSHL